MTVFGSFASRVALVTLMSTTIAAAMLTFAALRAGRRVIGLSGQMRNAYLTSRNLDVSDPSSEVPGFWAPGSSMPRTFPTTPVTAHVSHVTATIAGLLQPNQTVYCITLFAFTAAPFLALSGAIAVTRIPGVDWSGGLIGPVLGLGLHP